MLSTLLTLVIVAQIVGFIVFMHYARDLPDFSQLSNYDPPTVTRFYAGDGRILAEYATEKRIFVPLSAIPKHVIAAFLAAEDKNFYNHTGIDLTGVARALYANIINYGQGRASLAGGSTITQQVVKNFLLTNEKSMDRKIKEAILALRISNVYSKDKILELYLNEIYLGLGSYGVATASLNYFNKSLEELNIEEAALLAAMPKAPSSYDPRRNYENAKIRRDWVMGRMVEDGYITADEAKQAQATPITLRARAPEEVTHAEFFAEEVRRDIAARFGENVLYEGGLVVHTTLNPKLQAIADRSLRRALMDYDRRRGFRGPVGQLATLSGDWQEKLKEMERTNPHVVEGQSLAVVTALDDRKAVITLADGSKGILPMSLLGWTRRVLGDGVLGPEVKRPDDILKVRDIIIVGAASEEQKKTLTEAERKVAWDLQQTPEVNGALVALDPNTGRVLALTGGYDHFSTFNRATQAKRQPGSAIKPFVYMTGLENGFTPATIILDAPVEMSQGAGLPTWKPENYKDEYLGPATMRVGLEKSRNTMTVRLAQMLGLDGVLSILKRLEIYNEPPHHFSIVLGSAETTLLKLVNAYGMIDNGGKRITPSLIERIDDRHGRVVYRHDTRTCAACAVEDAAAITDNTPPALEDARPQVIDPRIAYQMTSMLEGVVQRGTAVRAKVLGRPLAGKTGTTNQSMDTWFIGFSPDLVVGVFVGYDSPRTLGKKETGGSVALPAFIAFMQEALKDVPPRPFPIPPGIRLERIDLHSGMPAADVGEASNAIIQEAFVVGEPVFVPGQEQEKRKTQGEKEQVIDSTPPPDVFVTGQEERTEEDQRKAGFPPSSHIPPPPLPEPLPQIMEPSRPSVGTGGLY